LRSKEKEKGLSLSHIINLVANYPSNECCNDTKENIQECLSWWAFSVNNEECAEADKPSND
jgi:hypothetical protein